MVLGDLREDGKGLVGGAPPVAHDIAQSVMRRAGVDPSEHYRRLVVRTPPEPSVLAGLGETGSPDDGEIAMRWLSHPRARGRVEAIRAWRRLGVTRRTLLVPLLEDESAAVTRQAVAILRRDAVVDAAALRALLSAANPSHVRFAGYRLLTGGDAWQRLSTDLQLVADPDLRLRGHARADLTAWLDHEAATAYLAPGRDRAAAFEYLVEEARPVLGEDKTRLLRFHTGLTPATDRPRLHHSA
ncbi:hypothetical protein GCM10010435_82320 [Winogradskya consettensis]|uniref:Uncharacterized protein n=1 Tax=Winogradskya consettensis TaxID=113560 RepID=A0A919SWT6_9ACTN|nr:hypothetical protein Aco04nite_63900 [Actinoplanes consettensis]